MTDQLRQAATLALDALTYIYTDTTADEDELIDQAITAIKEALAREHAMHDLARLGQEIEQAEPPPEWPLIKNILAEYGLQAIGFVADWKATMAEQQCQWPKCQNDGYQKILAKQIQQELFTGRPWVGLTDEEMSDIVADIDVDFGDLLWKVVCLTKIIQATIKERNT